jgi:hypothetical protein
MKDSRKGQVSLEFLVYTSVFMLAFVIVIFIFSDMSRYEVSKNDYIMATIVGSKVMSFATVAYSMGPDFRTSFDLPASINGFSYTVVLDRKNSLVDVTVADSFVTHFSSKSIDYRLVTKQGSDTVVLNAGDKVFVHMEDGGLCLSTTQGGVCG